MPDPNNVLIREHGVVFMLTCKAANTSIKAAIMARMGLSPSALHRTQLYFPTPNRGDIRRLRHQEGFCVVGTIRHPMSRLFSLWCDKVRDKDQFHQPFRRKYGTAFWPGMSFPAFVWAVCQIDDGIADQHFRSMAWDLVDEADQVVPQHLYDVESEGWWERMRTVVLRRGLDIGPERFENHRQGEPTGPWQSQYDDRLAALTRARYSDDFRIFGYDDP